MKPRLSEESDRIEVVCLRLLARREHSVFELRRKLMQRGFDPSIIDPVLEKLSDKGLQDNLRFGEDYCSYRAERGFGPLRIRKELVERGLCREEIDFCLSSWAGRWDQVLVRVFEKKYVNFCPRNSTRVLECSRFLLQRGFSKAQIDRLFDQL